MIDLAAQNADIRADVEASLAEIHLKTSYVGGVHVEAFEHAFADYLGVRHVVGVGSGTEALYLSLRALNIGDGDEVITTPMTFIATAEAIVQTGATPVFVDVDPVTCNISPSAVRNYLEAGRFKTPNGPKAILPVHLYGTPAPMRELLDMAQRFRLKVVEDACQAHGARVRLERAWVRAGAAGVMGCFSFYPGKNLGAWGEAGAIATNDSDLAKRVALLRDHGRTSHYLHQESGYNARLDSIQGAVLSAKLKWLERWNSRRREAAEAYREMLTGHDLVLPVNPDFAESCYHLFVIRNRHRDALVSALRSASIECGIHYPVPLHLQPAFAHLRYRRGDFPVSEEISDTVLSLPMHPHLSRRALERVVEVIEQVQGQRNLDDTENKVRESPALPSREV
jgi:dTDP-4-amino-4,6-dideoxygalactose transaminase